MGFPQTSPLPVYTGAATPGDIAFDAPMNATSYNLFSSGTPNLVGNAYTITTAGSPNPTNGASLSGTATVGGTGSFAGILVGSKQYVNIVGTSAGALSPTLALPDYYDGASLCYFGQVWVSLDNIPNVGDLVTYNPANGNISSIPPQVNFVGSSSTTTLTVASITSGRIYIGMPVLSTTVSAVAPGTYITALGSGLGGVGTYTINNSQSIASSTAMYAPNVPAPAVAATASQALFVLTVTAISAGEIYVGMPVNGVGFAAGTVVTAFIPSTGGVGGTGTYTVNVSQTVTPAVAITDSANILIPHATVSHFNVTYPGLAVISMTNS